LARRRQTAILSILCIPVCSVAAGERVNVALSKWGATAAASSEYGPEYEAAKALDGRWANRETDKWNSAAGRGAHWLRIDLGCAHLIDRIVIRHEGVFAEGDRYNTSDFRLERSDVPDGPWTALAPPVRGNTESVTTHEFGPARVRHLRLFMTKAEQRGNAYGRIFEVEVLAPVRELASPLLGITFPSPAKHRKRDGRVEKLAHLEVFPPRAPGGTTAVLVGIGDLPPVDFGRWDLTGRKEIWLPAGRGASKGPLSVALIARTAGGRKVIAERTLQPPESVTWGHFAGGTVHIIQSSHQDIGWMDTPQKCIEFRDKNNITPALELMKRNKDYCFGMEDVLCLMEYLERHPDRKAEIHQRMKEGRLEWGATYNEPYESLLSGEQLVRETYLGRKWLKKHFPGCDARVAWNPDTPSRPIQMQQILAKAGIPYMLISRHREGYFRWSSPDGSSIIVYSPGHYTLPSRWIRGGPERARSNLAKQMKRLAPYYEKHNIAPELPVLMSHDWSRPTDNDALIRHWNAATGAALDPPKIRYSISTTFFDALVKGAPEFETLRGERPNVWLYIHGPTHHRAISAKREAGVLLPAAETFATIEALLSGSLRGYPTEEFDRAWRGAIYPDHGWGGNQGHVTDRVFRENLELGRDIGRKILDRSLGAIAARVKTSRAKGLPVVVFNALSWQRADPVVCSVKPPARPSRVVDSKGAAVPHQVLPAAAGGDGGSKADAVRIVFIARDVPPIGYRTYYVTSGAAKGDRPAGTGTRAGSHENRYYRIKLAPGGITGIYDKSLRREVLRTDKFLGAEVFTMQSKGNGAGEFADVQQPTMEGFDRLSNHKPEWSVAESGPVRAAFAMEQKLAHCTVRQKLVIYSGIKRIDCEVSILGWDGTKSREFRMALPANVAKVRVAYEVPMGVLEAGKDEIAGAAGWRHKTPCRYVRPREVQNFISASDDSLGVTMSSSVAVCDFLDVTARPVTYPMLQPVLLASRRSCNRRGNWYLQAGDHHYSFSILSHEPGWRGGRRFGIQANNPLVPVVAGRPAARATLPEEKSFCSVSPGNVIVSTIKKCEDGESVIVRCYDIEGTDSRAKLNVFFPVSRAEHTNIIEEEGKAIPFAARSVELDIGHHAIETLKLVPAFRKQR
jgi:alpha-mannosidase